MRNLIKKILKESAGVSFDVREWSKVLWDKIYDAASNEEDRVIVDGYDYPEIYEKFPVDYFVIDFYDEFTGYDVKKSGYDKDGYYVVLLYIQPKILNIGSPYRLDTALNHELKHAYQDYMRVSKGGTNIDNTKESKEFYTDDFIGLLNSGKRGTIKNILKYYYYLSNLERDAYLENVYDRKGNYEEIVRDILNKNFSDFIPYTNDPIGYMLYGQRRKLLDNEWSEVTQLDIPLLKKFKNPDDFINYSSNRLKKQAEKIIKKINKLKYIHNK